MDQEEQEYMFFDPKKLDDDYQEDQLFPQQNDMNDYNDIDMNDYIDQQGQQLQPVQPVQYNLSDDPLFTLFPTEAQKKKTVANAQMNAMKQKIIESDKKKKTLNQQVVNLKKQVIKEQKNIADKQEKQDKQAIIKAQALKQQIIWKNNENAAIKKKEIDDRNEKIGSDRYQKQLQYERQILGQRQKLSRMGQLIDRNRVNYRTLRDQSGNQKYQRYHKGHFKFNRLEDYGKKYLFPSKILFSISKNHKLYQNLLKSKTRQQFKQYLKDNEDQFHPYELRYLTNIYQRAFQPS